VISSIDIRIAAMRPDKVPTQIRESPRSLRCASSTAAALAASEVMTA
jgi:hypothetical protein